jgi:hypothetical protein
MGIIAAMWTLPRHHDDIKGNWHFCSRSNAVNSAQHWVVVKEYETCPGFWNIKKPGLNCI